MTYFYLKNNEIKMRSEGPIIAPAFEEIILDITEDELDKLNRNWKAKIINGKLELEMSHQELSEKQKKDREKLVGKLKTDTQSATTISQLKTILTSVLSDLK